MNSRPPEETKSAPLTGADAIRRYLKEMPTAPGVYRMLDVAGNVLYVGKAKNLKNRVSSYVNTGGLSQRIARMVSHTASMEIVTTHTEAEALLLEANLIKKLSPRYNILLRDDKSFPFILLTSDHDFPRIVKHRGAQNKKGKYFGPFASTGAVNATLAILQKAFLLRPCPDTVFSGRTRPCLQYQIKRCSAPCVDKISKTEYAALIDQAKTFLQGKSRDIQDALAKDMQAASDAMDYEKAAELRDRIKALTRVQQEQRLQCPAIGDADMIGIFREGNRSCVQVFFFRGGQNFGNKSFFPSHSADAETKDVLAAFIGQFYQTHMPPKTILLSEEADQQNLLQDALSLRAERQVSVQIPARGDKLTTMKQVVKNAEEALERYRSQQAGQRERLEGVTKLFELESTPERIEVYDNSHISGRHALGAMIVAGPEGFMKNAYRQFNIKERSSGAQPNAERSARPSRAVEEKPLRGKEAERAVSPRSGSPDEIQKNFMGQNTIRGGDDYAMLRETLTRRFHRLQKEDPDREKHGNWPDLLLIDGGAGHLTTTISVFNELGISDVPFVCIAKGVDRNAGREWFHMPEREAFQLPKDDPVLHYLQQLRDEAHRFAIGSHRAKRSKSLKKSELDSVPGIGSTRKKALLHHFGSAKAVSSASLAELEHVPGINKKTAQAIYNYFHS